MIGDILDAIQERFGVVGIDATIYLLITCIVILFALWVVSWFYYPVFAALTPFALLGAIVFFAMKGRKR